MAANRSSIQTLEKNKRAARGAKNSLRMVKRWETIVLSREGKLLFKGNRLMVGVLRPVTKLTAFSCRGIRVEGRGVVGSEAGRAAEDGRIAGRKEQLHSPRPRLRRPPQAGGNLASRRPNPLPEAPHHEQDALQRRWVTLPHKQESCF